MPLCAVSMAVADVAFDFKGSIRIHKIRKKIVPGID